MNKLIAGIAGICLLTSCTKEPLPSGTPDCVQDLIRDLKKAQVQNPPAKLYSFVYQSETVYYVPGGCCDLFSTLYDSDCNIICHPDGGFTGGGDGECPDFQSEASDQKLLWEDPRE